MIKPNKYLTQEDIDLRILEHMNWKKSLPKWAQALDDEDNKRIEHELTDIMISKEIDDLNEQGACACEQLKKQYTHRGSTNTPHLCKLCSAMAIARGDYDDNSSFFQKELTERNLYGHDEF